MNAWAIIDRCTLIKGMGHFDFETLLQQLANMSGPQGLEQFPIPSGDIGGGNLRGVEADAVWEAIYQGLISREDAMIIHAGPQQGQEEVYLQALQRGISAGAPTINQAIDLQNAKWEEDRGKRLTEGKTDEGIPMALPHAFDNDLGHYVINKKWAEGVWGPMDKKKAWQMDVYGVPQIRIGNRDKEDMMAESWARPYSEGLSEVRKSQGHSGGTKHFIESHRVQPHSVYINHEAYKHIISMMRGLAAEGREITPDLIRDKWINHDILRNHLPHQHTPIDSHYNIRNSEMANVAPASSDVAEAAIEQRTQADDTWRSYFNEHTDNNRNGISIVGDDRRGGAWANPRYYAPVLAGQFGAYHKLRNMPPVNEIMRLGREQHGEGGNKIHQIDALRLGLASLAGWKGGATPPAVAPPAPAPAPPAPAPAPPAPAPAPIMPNPPQGQVPNSLPVAPTPPPVPRQQPPPPVPVGNQPPNIMPQRPPSNLNTNQVQPIASGRTDSAPHYSNGWRGMAERLAEKVGRGAGHVANFFTKEEIEMALENVQYDMAMQNENIVKMLPNVNMQYDNARDITMMAGKIHRPSSDVVAILNSKGDWREMAKSMDIPVEYVELVKVSFR